LKLQIDYTTWYVTDAAGNELSIYSTNQSTTTTPTPLQTEIAVYGQSRAGIYNLSYSNTTTGGVTTYTLSGTAFNYEIKDHLGNVRVNISRNLTTGGAVNIMSWADYYPFGEVMRSSSTAGYNDRYGYQGEYAECDPETATTTSTEAIGGWNSFDLRMYDANVGRWLSVDPKKQYWSPYLGMGNNPINLVDPDGGGTEDWGQITDPQTGQTSYKWFGQGVKVSDGYTFVSTKFNYFTQPEIQHDQTATFEFAPGTLKGMNYVNNSSDNPVIWTPETTIIYEGTTYQRGQPIMLGEHSTSDIPVDAVLAPSIRQNSVYKVISGNAVKITNDGISISHYYNNKSMIGQSLPWYPGEDVGGWYPGTFGQAVPDAFEPLLPYSTLPIPQIQSIR